MPSILSPTGDKQDEIENLMCPICAGHPVRATETHEGNIQRRDCICRAGHIWQVKWLVAA